MATCTRRCPLPCSPRTRRPRWFRTACPPVPTRSGSASSESGASGSARLSCRQNWTFPECSTASTSAWRWTGCASGFASWTDSWTSASANRDDPPYIPGCGGPRRPSQCPYGAYDAAAEGSLPAAVGVQPEPVQFPLAVLRVIREYAPRGVAGRSARQVQDEVGILGHCLLLCASRRGAQAVPGNLGTAAHQGGRQLWPGTVRVAFRVAEIRQVRHFKVAPRMVLAAGVALKRGENPRGDGTGQWRGCEVGKSVPARSRAASKAAAASDNRTRTGDTVAANGHGTRLVIVESPAKARTIAGYLGKGYVVESSIGHIRDMPDKAAEIPQKYRSEPWARLGVDVDHDFAALYVVPSDKKQQVSKLKTLLKNADELYLATDEDREGEAIAWHLLEELKPKIPARRMVFHEITPEAIARAVANPTE